MFFRKRASRLARVLVKLPWFNGKSVIREKFDGLIRTKPRIQNDILLSSILSFTYNTTISRVSMASLMNSQLDALM